MRQDDENIKLNVFFNSAIKKLTQKNLILKIKIKYQGWTNPDKNELFFELRFKLFHELEKI